MRRFSDVADAELELLRAQSAYGRAKAVFQATIFRTFKAVCPVRAGARISFRDEIGRAVVLQSGSRIGLYIDCHRVRTAIDESDFRLVKVLKTPRKNK
jgi:hypothetical protein